jgi:hypothetical protein
MPRRSWVLLAIAWLVAFGVWRLLHSAPLLFADETWSLVPLALFLQGMLAVLAAGALFYRMEIGSALVLLFGLAVGVTALLESFVWEITAPLAGIVVFAVAILAAVFLARFLRGERVV